MNLDETTSTCPYCGASYRARDTTCPRCGKALSPTGYSQYGESTVRSESQPIVPLARATVGRIDRSRTRGAQVQARRNYVPVGVVIVLVISFFILNGQNRSDSNMVLRPVAVFPNPPTPVRPFACLPPPEATAYPLMPPAEPSVAIGPPPVGTMAYLPSTGTPTPRPASPRVNYILNISTEKGLLQAKMYDIVASAANLPPVDHLRGALSAFSDGSVTIFTGNTIYADFTPTALPYRCGSVLMLVSNGRVGGDQLTVIRSDDPAGALASTQKYGFTYTVVGQLISGYDVLGALNAGDMVIGASVASRH